MSSSSSSSLAVAKAKLASQVLRGQYPTTNNDLNQLYNHVELAMIKCSRQNVALARQSILDVGIRHLPAIGSLYLTTLSSLEVNKRRRRLYIVYILSDVLMRGVGGGGDSINQAIESLIQLAAQIQSNRPPLYRLIDEIWRQHAILDDAVLNHLLELVNNPHSHHDTHIDPGIIDEFYLNLSSPQTYLAWSDQFYHTHSKHALHSFN